MEFPKEFMGRTTGRQSEAVYEQLRSQSRTFASAG